jgi:poly(3-hydroxyalkanoate) synthetase
MLSSWSPQNNPISPAELIFTPGPSLYARYIGDQARKFTKYKQFMRSIKGKTAQWATANEILYHGYGYNLRGFGLGDESLTKTPYLISPPNAGHGSQLADFLSGKSITETFLNLGHPVYVIEWLDADPQNIQFIYNLVQAVNESINYVSQRHNNIKVRTAGLCQGGWVLAAAAALQPEKIEGFITAGTPADATRGDNFITRVSKLPIEIFQYLVHALGRDNVQEGYNQLEGFLNTDPLAKKFTLFWDIMRNIDDSKFIERSEPFIVWFINTIQGLSLWQLESMEKIFKANQLFNNQLEILQ